MNFAKISPDTAVVAITGAARGIGYATAKRFIEAGAKVALGDLIIEDARTAAAKLGPRASAFQIDAGDRDSYTAFVDAVEQQLGPVDILVNNAGIMPVGSVLEEEDSIAVATMRVNFWAHYYGLKIVAPRMVSRGRGHIVNVTSGAGRLHAPGLATYVASKHAAQGLSRSAREELLGTGVSVSAVMPAAVRTQLHDGLPTNPIVQLTMVTPETVAQTILSTLKDRPATVGVPRGLDILADLMGLLPSRVVTLSEKLMGAEHFLGPIDREKRSEYDRRIQIQSGLDEGATKLVT